MPLRTFHLHNNIHQREFSFLLNMAFGLLLLLVSQRLQVSGGDALLFIGIYIAGTVVSISLLLAPRGKKEFVIWMKEMHSSHSRGHRQYDYYLLDDQEIRYRVNREMFALVDEGDLIAVTYNMQNKEIVELTVTKEEATINGSTEELTQAEEHLAWKQRRKWVFFVALLWLVIAWGLWMGWN